MDNAGITLTKILTYSTLYFFQETEKAYLSYILKYLGISPQSLLFWLSLHPHYHYFCNHLKTKLTNLRLLHPYKLDKSIFHLRGIWCVFPILFILNRNSCMQKKRPWSDAVFGGIWSGSIPLWCLSVRSWSSNAIFCSGCKRWVHKKCSGIKGPLRPDPEFRCAWCLGTARPIDEREVSEFEVGNKKLEVVPEFCYLGDMLSAGGGCELAAITRCKCAWGKFHQLLPLLTNHHLPLLTRGKVYSSCVRSVMLHAAETCAMKVDTLNHLQLNDRAMIRWICNVRAKDEVSSDALLIKLGIQDLRCGAPHQ